MKKIIPFIFILLWIIIIFYASSKSSIESNSKSKEIIYNITYKVVKVTNKLKITKINLDNERILWKIVDRLNKPLRKCTHALEYLVLASLLVIAFYKFNMSWKKIILISIFICFFYSLTDEYHQTFVSGRKGELIDCGIDTLGATIGSVITTGIIFKKEKGEKHE